MNANELDRMRNFNPLSHVHVNVPLHGAEEMEAF